ncbi:hypothetical protein [Herbaspirillum sp. NPDC087042]|uniref:hypothetical protein n=1 Tax=Herbaspirillum sp. NPDC087042 TaxID=3364004 RepID=UPI00380B2469
MIVLKFLLISMFVVTWLRARHSMLVDLKTHGVLLSSERMSVSIAVAAAIVLLAILLLFMASPEFRHFKSDVLRFLAFRFEGSDYRLLRNERYSDGWRLENVIGRLRFTLFPVLFCLVLYTGWSGINMLAKVFGLVPRLPDIEVARTLLGPDSGSNPGIYFLGGYAAFGMGGLCLFAALGPLLLWMLDLLGRRIRAAPLRATFLAVVGMNGVFLNQIALQTALVTYGLALLPLVLFGLDLVVCRIWRGQGGRPGAG